MSPKLEFLSNFNVTKFGMSLKLKCHTKWNVPQIRVSLKYEQARAAPQLREGCSVASQNSLAQFNRGTQHVWTISAILYVTESSVMTQRADGAKARMCMLNASPTGGRAVWKDSKQKCLQTRGLQLDSRDPSTQEMSQYN